ncbi:MAG: Gfo/Idh/MocA family oxidoreductase [Bacteroidota bacterium]
MKRRDLLKGFASLPLLGVFGWGIFRKKSDDEKIKKKILTELNIKAKSPTQTGSMSGDVIRLGIVGAGGRGRHLMRAAGYADPEWLKKIEEANNKNSLDKRLETYLNQESLNIKFTAVCDVFDEHTAIASNTVNATIGEKPKEYRNYRELLNDPNVDAVIIATPDHWHAPIATEAIRAGKHVYVEKCMTHKVEETFELRNAVLENNDVVFQLGHQHRQTESFLTAMDIIDKNVLGHVSLIEACTNRNDDGGAWQYWINDKANASNVDWKQFLGSAKDIPFNPEHLFRWRKYWAYGTGLSGDLLPHDYDGVNSVLKMGIPDSVMTSGGIYTHRDNREVPDVMQVAMEYPDFSTGSSQEKGKEKGMTFLYSATLGNQHWRPTKMMGHDATLEFGEVLTIYPDHNSTRYKDMLEKKVIETSSPMYSYDPRFKGVDAVTSATSKYFAQKGLLYTHRDGRQVDSTHLHIREWINGIRNGQKVSCGIQEGFEEAISAHMATLSYKTGKRVHWDKDNEKIIIHGMEDADLDSIIMNPDKV